MLSNCWLATHPYLLPSIFLKGPDTAPASFHSHISPQYKNSTGNTTSSSILLSTFDSLKVSVQVQYNSFFALLLLQSLRTSRTLTSHFIIRSHVACRNHAATGRHHQLTSNGPPSRQECHCYRSSWVSNIRQFKSNYTCVFPISKSSTLAIMMLVCLLATLSVETLLSPR